MNILTSDEHWIKYCISLAEKSVDEGENPFGSVIVRNENIVVASINGVKKNMDIASHAEMLVMKKAQHLLKTTDFSEYEIYSNCEPCAMCALIIRALKFKRVVFSLPSPYMGGYSKWHILQDPDLIDIQPDFSEPPEVVPNILINEAIKTFQRAGWGKMFEK
jgi:tRNA(adenine34) deaminase